jgi:hypothetical protein
LGRNLGPGEEAATPAEKVGPGLDAPGTGHLSSPSMSDSKNTYTLVHVGPPNKPSVKVQKVRAYNAQAAMLPFKGRQMTPEEIGARKK